MLIRVDNESPEQYRNQLIQLNLDFQSSLGNAPDETKTLNGLACLLDPQKPGQVFLYFDSDNKAVGMAYGNLGSGMAVGGMYLWLNAIYLIPDVRGKEVGKRFLKAISDWAVARECVYICCTRNPENEASERLFASAGFEQSESIWMERTIEQPES